MFLHPPSSGPYHLYIKDMYRQTASEMPAGTEFQAIVKAINLKWKELPLAERKKFENAYLIDREQQAVDESVGGDVSKHMT